MKKIFTKIFRIEYIVFIIFFAFAWALMWKTFKLTPSGDLKIAVKVSSDFAATIPLIRSFSFGANFPPQYPLFSGPPIRYHFVFFALAGLIERIGVPIDWAFNSLSIVSFFLLLVAIYYLAYEMFGKKSVSFLACLMFLFNGSLSFLQFFKNNPLSVNTLKEIVQNNTFYSFGPYYGDKLVAAFWSLNIYTNQRHLALGYFLFLVILLALYRATKKPITFTWLKVILLAILAGLFPFIHMAVFAMVEMTLVIAFVLFSGIRKKVMTILIISLALALPQVAYMGHSAVTTKFYHPGYLIDNLTYLSFLKYWFFNLGLASVLAPVGFFLAGRMQKKIFLPFLAFFVVGNLFQFSAEIAGNHKFFNLFIIGANIFAAWAIYQLWHLKIIGKLLTPVVIFAVMLSGIIDFFPVKNDLYVEIPDYPKDPHIKWIVENTSPKAVFLNSGYTYHAATLAGRPVFLGWLYFVWGAGYDVMPRLAAMEKIYGNGDKSEICRLAAVNHIDYMTLEDTSRDPVLPKINLTYYLENFKLAYADSENQYYIVDVKENCGTQTPPQLNFRN